MEIEAQAEMSFTMDAPASSAAQATEDFVVSIEIGMEVSLAKASITGTMRPIPLRRNSRRPGRVDSPPMSMMSAPSSIICSAR